MADGEHSLPPNEELFEQPMEQEPQQYELPRADQGTFFIKNMKVNTISSDQGYHGVPEDPQASGGAPPHDMEHHYPVQEDHLANSGYYEPTPPTATNQVFQPTPQQNFVAPQPRDAQNYEEQGAGDAGGGGAAVNGEDPPGDADTVWIDSDSDDDPEAEFLRANFGLTYSGYVPIEEDEEEATAATVKEELQQQHHQEYQSPPLQQQQVHPMRQTMRPVVAAQPFSIGGNQVEYAEPRMPPRGVSVAPRDTQFRIINELGHPMMASSQQHHGIRAQSVSSTRVLNNSPHATIIRQQPQHPQTLYQAPQGSLRGTPLQSQQQRLGGATPGSYQHIVNPSPSGNFGATIRRQVPAQGAPRGVGGPGIVVSSNQLGPRPGVRPVHVTRPMTDNLDREFIEHPMPLPPQGPPATAQIRRAPADVAPHRMTAEQRLEQQQLNRQRAQFPMQRGGVQQPQQQATNRVPTQQAAIIGRGRGGVMAVGSPGHEDLLRSPQRGIQERQPVVCEPRKFQVRVTDTYSAPIPKASDQLPAQLTEDPPEEVQKVEEPTDEAPEASDVKQEIKSPSRLTSATSSPVKSHGIQQKPTPPHRMTQEEKNAHLAKLSTDKEKPTNLNTLPLRGVHHQDDTLAVVQSVFESNKPRQPDTPKDKEAISKIADLLRFSAEEFSGASGSGTSNTRQRSISGGANRAQNYGSAPMVQPHHQPHLHHQQQQPPPNPMDDEARRKRHGSGRYDNNMGIGGQNPMHQMRSPQHSAHIQQQAGEPEPNLDPPIRPRGRPRGTTQQRVARFGNAPETLAPHRAAGGARTLPPRQVQQHQEPPAPPPRAAMSANSDSESEAVDSESWEMRCHCDMDHGDGETVECESCKTWQHMACMGLNMNSDTTKYKCEQCQPRRLPVTKAEAIRTQKKILEKLRRATERERRNKRKSEPVEPVKPVIQVGFLGFLKDFRGKIDKIDSFSVNFNEKLTKNRLFESINFSCH
ncbi:hypothetical protein CRE_09936 [Caenorhabditis remanei]|uniref:Zinc finger PHD-type domain-containing protein n=1 Tax=Caenorhabditis remanei TaxID=31234 RepID=E3NTT4_CAERE|nr:hypothetical protein CRE_09936 [Caenorhabditis remanei]